MHDVWGEQAERIADIEALSRVVFRSFGFREMRTPVLESKELFTRALGTSTDVVQKEMYEFEDRSGERVAMRPEGTAGIVRAYLENELHKSEGLLKLFYIGAMFRSERPQAGRLRQFHQIGVETLGTDSPLADAEAIGALTAFLDRAGAGGYTLKLNNLGTFEERDAYKRVLRDHYQALAAKLCDDCRTRLEKNVFRLLDCKQPGCRAMAKNAPAITGSLSEESQRHFARVLEALAEAGIATTLDPHLVRGLDYYTRTVFEVLHPKLGAQDALAAGGRYDRLIESFGGPRCGAVGFAVGVERLLMCAVPTSEPGAYRPGVFVATLGEAAVTRGFKLAAALRADGIEAAMDLEGRSLKAQMRSADRLKLRYSLVLGDNELRDGACQLKDMKNGQQEAVRLDQLGRELRSRIEKNKDFANA